MRRTQQGLTLLGFVIVLAVVGFFAYIGMRLIPSYSEYYSVVKALKSVSQEPGIATQSEHKVQGMLGQHFNISYVTSVQPENVKIKRDQNGMTLSVDYEVRKPVFGNVDLIIHFQKTVSSSPDKPVASG